MQPDLVTRSLCLRSVNKAHRSAEFIASTDAIDSWDEIVEQDWDLKRFLANPVILFAHNSWQLPIGKATRCEVVNATGRAQLECTVEFLSEKANPLAEQVWNSVQEGGLRAVSVGFRPGDARLEKRNGREVWVLSQNELMEISVVPIPANPEAVAKMKAKALGERIADKIVNPKADASASATEQPTALEATTERSMDPKELERRIAGLEVEIRTAQETARTAQAQLTDAKTALSEAQTSLTRITAERDAAVAKATAAESRAKAAEDRCIESDVDALVGKKITPAQRDTFVNLAKTARASFDAVVATMPDLALTQRVAGGQPLHQTAPVASGNGAELGALLEASLNS